MLTSTGYLDIISDLVPVYITSVFHVVHKTREIQTKSLQLFYQDDKNDMTFIFLANSNSGNKLKSI